MTDDWENVRNIVFRVAVVQWSRVVRVDENKSTKNRRRSDVITQQHRSFVQNLNVNHNQLMPQMFDFSQIFNENTTANSNKIITIQIYLHFYAFKSDTYTLRMTNINITLHLIGIYKNPSVTQYLFLSFYQLDDKTNSKSISFIVKMCKVFFLIIKYIM